MIEEEVEEKESIKVILIGDAGVGKTNLINVASGRKFNENETSTLSASYVKKEININGEKYNISLWDTIGQEKFRSLTKLFFKDSDIVIFVFDITTKETFTELEYWFKTINDELGDGPIKGLAANKQDLFEKQEVDDNTIQIYAHKKGLKFKFTTATNPTNFNKLLEELLSDFLKNGTSEKRKKVIGKKLTKKKAKDKKKRC